MHNPELNMLQLYSVSWCLLKVLFIIMPFIFSNAKYADMVYV
jgi:hypothetical protein